jgi:hypothetical protein
MSRIAHIEKMIFWQEYVRDNTRDRKQKDRCNAAIEKLLGELMDEKRQINERSMDRGLREHAAWYDTSAELN